MIGIDSMVLIYAGIVPRKAAKKSKQLDELSVRARLLLHMKREEIIAIPAIAVSEVLVPVASEKRGELIAKLTGAFVCPTFDLHAASIAAYLWNEYKKLPKKGQYTRQTVRADTMIIASAKAAGATEFYTHDSKCRTLASKVMVAKDLPINDPNDIYAADDIRRGEL